MKKQPDFEQMYFDFVDMYSSEANKHLNTVVELNWANIQRDELEARVEQLEQQLASATTEPLPVADPFSHDQTLASSSHTTQPSDWKQSVLQLQPVVNQIGAVALGTMVLLVGVLCIRRRVVMSRLSSIDPRWRQREKVA